MDLNLRDTKDCADKIQAGDRTTYEIVSPLSRCIGHGVPLPEPSDRATIIFKGNISLPPFVGYCILL